MQTGFYRVPQRARHWGAEDISNGGATEAATPRKPLTKANVGGRFLRMLALRLIQLAKIGGHFFV